jgi:hypothetical protein
MLLLPLTVLSQKVSISKLEVNGNKVIVHYDLEDNNPNNQYLLNLYASRDNYSAPLTKVKGDVGMDINPGGPKRMEWNITEEYGAYKGRLSLEIRGKVYVPFARLQAFDTEKSYKRGHSYGLNWKPGNTNPVNIELYKGGERVGGDINLPNNGSHTLFIPSHAKKGDDYRLKVSDAKNSEEVIYTEYFKVTPKVGLMVKLLPILAVGGAVAVLAGGSKDPGTTTAGTIADPKFPGN